MSVYFVYFSEEQKLFLSNLLEDPTIIPTFNDYIEESSLQEYLDILLSYLEREKFRKDLAHRQTQYASTNSDTHTPFQKQEALRKIKQISRDVTTREIERIKSNILFMPINNKLETIMDICCHSNLEWIDHTSLAKSKKESPEEIQLKEIRKTKSFGKKTLGNISQYNTEEPSTPVEENITEEISELLTLPTKPRSISSPNLNFNGLPKLTKPTKIKSPKLEKKIPVKSSAYDDNEDF